MQAWRACGAKPIRFDTVHRVTSIFVGHAGCLSGETRENYSGIPITSHSLSPLSGADSASIIPEIGFGGVGGDVYVLLCARVHLNGG